MDDILLESSLIHQKAEQLLRDFQIVEMWESIGAEVRTVGSFRSSLMIDKDIDLHVYTSELDAAKTFQALTPLLGDSRVIKCKYINGADTDEHCLEWHLRLADDSGEEWTIDMIQILAGTKYAGVMEDVAEAVIDAATPEIRKRILVLKNACPDGVKICGIEYCKAVIDDRVTSWPEFMAWRENNPPDSLMDWKPAVR